MDALAPVASVATELVRARMPMHNAAEEEPQFELLHQLNLHANTSFHD